MNGFQARLAGVSSPLAQSRYRLSGGVEHGHTCTVINMAMNRRNVLIGLGTVAVGGGAAFGSGAFSSVEADRTVSISTASDSDAFVGISVDGSYAVDNSGSNDAVTIDLEGSDSSDGFNDDAQTDVNGVLTLTNQAADGGDIDVGFDDSGSITNSTTLVLEDDGSTVSSEVEFTLANASEGTAERLSDTNSVDVNATIRTGSRTTSEPDGSTQSTLTIRAESA